MSDESKIELISGEVCAVELRPGDRLVILLEHPVPFEHVERMRELMDRWAPGVPCLVLDRGASLAVLRAPETPA